MIRMMYGRQPSQQMKAKTVDFIRSTVHIHTMGTTLTGCKRECDGIELIDIQSAAPVRRKHRTPRTSNAAQVGQHGI